MNIFKKSRGLLASFVVVAAVLPMILVATLSEDLRLKTFADSRPEVRVWMEPEEVVIKAGNNFMVRMYAESSGQEVLVPQITASINAPEGVQVRPNPVMYVGPFSGRVSLGEVNVTVSREGEFDLTIPDLAVDTRLADVQVVTRGVKILSRK